MKPKNKYNVRETIKCTSYLFQLIWSKKYGPSYVIMKGLLSLIDALLPLAVTVLPGLIINELVGGKNIPAILVYLSLLLFLPLLSHLIRGGLNGLILKRRYSLSSAINADFFTHLSHVDFEYREDPELGDKTGRAQDTMLDSLNIVSRIFNLFSAVLSVIGLASIISTLTPLMIIVIIAIMYLNSIITKKLNEKIYGLDLESDRISRFLLVAHNPLAQYLYAKEMKLYQLTPYMIGKLREVQREDYKIENEKEKSRNAAGALHTLLNLASQLFLYAYLIISVLRYDMPVGSMAIYLSAGGQFAASVNNVFNSYMDLAGKAPAVNELIEYMSMPMRRERAGELTPVFDKDSTVEFRNVSFRYPGSDRYILRDFNITLKGDETLCVVGENGAGKTTFIKLLCRFFSPVEGEILLNGRNVEEYDMDKYHRLFASVFQDYQLYDGLTLGENITLSDARDDEKLDEVCESCGLKEFVEKLPRGYDTFVNKWVDENGVIPSGGEEQRIAIARARFRGGDIFLLDEPTASLDPVAEYEIYEKFHEMIEGKAAVLITHRLSAVQLADKVAVFDGGQVAEYGTHKELYAKGGIYKEMFDKQAHFYLNSTEKT